LHSRWRVEMSNRSNNRYHSTLHAFFLAAKKKGYSEFQLRLINPKGRIEFSISPQGRSEMSVRFEVRGNMVRVAAKDARIIPSTEDADVSYGGSRSGEVPVWAL
jgi:hypothetical protein